MRQVMAYRAFKWPKKAQSNFIWLQKYYFLVIYQAKLYTYFDTCNILLKY